MLLVYKLLCRIFHSFVEVIFLFLTLLNGKFFCVQFEYLCPRVRERVYGVSHSVYKARVVKYFLL